jgi:nucleoside diphosphate kinase
MQAGESGMQRTLAMIKPDAVAAGAAQSIIAKIEAAGFIVTRRRQYTMYPAQAEEFYAEHAGKPFFSKLVDFMTSGPIWALELHGAGAIKGWRTLMGPTNTLNAHLEAPDSIRAQFGTDGTRNAAHGSDSSASAEREIAFHFPSVQKTLAMIKPDAVAAGAAPRIKAQIQAQGLKVVRQREYRMSREQAESFYAEHAEKAFFAKLVEFMTSGSICALELEGMGAIAGWRAMMGPTDSSKAKASAPTTLRACFGTDGTKNAVHGSDSITSADREIAFHFSSDIGPGCQPGVATAPDSAPAEATHASEERAETVVVTKAESNVPSADEQAAAVLLQAAVRGNQARQQVEQLKQEQSAEEPSALHGDAPLSERVAEPPTEDEGEPTTSAGISNSEIEQPPTDGNEGPDNLGAVSEGGAAPVQPETELPAEADEPVVEETTVPDTDIALDEHEAEATAAQVQQDAGVAEEVVDAAPLAEQREA